jgi:endoglucanase
MMPKVHNYSGVKQNGPLHVEGVNLVNKAGVPIRLKGMSSYGMQWQPQFTSEGSVRTIRDYGANLLRVAMYTDENGYISNPEKLKKDVFNAVDTAIRLDMYTIIDWHILHDNNPQMYKKEAKEFFAEAAQRYAGNPAVLYEICNEPNGNVTWKDDIKPYAEEVIPIIRSFAPDSVVLVGTGTWSQDVNEPADSPLSFPNVMYTCHFYAGTHGEELRNKIDYALSKGAPIFISEWGTTQADGSHGVYIERSEEWLAFLDRHGLSWANWSLGDKDESSAALLPGASPEGNWKESDLSESGRFVFRKLSE